MSDIPPVPRAVPTAKEVAKALDRRQRRRKLVLFALLAGAIALAVIYGTCGHGWGLGAGGGKGEGETAATVDAAPRRCAIQVAREGVTVDGAKATREEAVAACKKAGAGADVIVTGDAREGDWKDLETALRAAKIEIFVRK